MSAQTTHKCSCCEYSTNRKFNLERHMSLVHNIHELPIDTSTYTHALNAQNVDDESTTTKVDVHSDLTCKMCDKVFSRPYSLKRHLDSNACRGGLENLQCPKCKKIFTSRSGKSHHMSICRFETGESSNAQLINNIQTQNINTINNTTNIVNNTTINNTLVFPEDIDSNFDFFVEKITKKLMKAIATAKPFIGFNKFVTAMMDDPRNRCVRKQSTHTSHSEIHTGENQWDLVLDKDVYPVLTHHLTTAALAKIDEFRSSMATVLEQFQNYVELLNTDNECEEYLDATQRMKLMIINLSRKWAKEEGISLA